MLDPSIITRVVKRLKFIRSAATISVESVFFVSNELSWRIVAIAIYRSMKMKVKLERSRIVVQPLLIKSAVYVALSKERAIITSSKEPVKSTKRDAR